MSDTKKCCICGKSFMPIRKNQVTCGSKECQKARHKMYTSEYMKHYHKVGNVDRKAYKRDKMRKYRAKVKEQTEHGTCAECEWCDSDRKGNEFVCVNRLSEYCTEYVEKTNSCKAFERGKGQIYE